MSEPAWVPLGAAPLPPTSAMELIREADLVTESVFASIPQTYDTLKLVWFARLTTAAVAASLYLRVNGDVGTTYDSSHIYVNNGALAQAQSANQSEALIGVMPGDTALAGMFGSGELLIPGYATGQAKSWSGRYQGFYARSAAGMYLGTVGGGRYNADPITQLSLIQQGGGPMAAGSMAWLYGIRGA